VSRCFFLLALALALTTPANGQAPARVIGRVADAATGAPVAAADVRLSDQHATTGSDGTFVVVAVTTGRVTLSVRRVGYSPWAETLDLVPGLDRAVTVELSPVALQLDSIRVVAGRGEISISGDELTSRGRDLARALDGWEGITVRRTGSSGPAAPQMRGGGPDEVLVLVDGFAANDPFTGRADLTRIQSRDVDRVTLLRGAQTARAGARAIAGVIVIETRQSIRPEGSAWMASDHARGARAGGSLGEISVNAATERYADRFSYTIPEVRGGGTGTRLNAGGDLSTASARLEGPVEVSVRGSMSDRDLPGTTTNPTLSATAHDRVVFAGVRRQGAWRWSSSLQWVETRAQDPNPPTGAAYDAYTHGIGATADAGYRASASVGGWSGDAGVTAEARGDRFGGDAVRAGASFSHVALRADAALRRTRGAVWTLAPALRLDMWTGQGTPELSARLDAGWQRGNTGITAAVGSAVTPPVLADLLFREGVGVRLNPDLRPERVRWEIEAGVRHELAAGTVSARLFYGHVQDMIVWAPDFRFIWSPGNFDVVRRGGEASVDLRPARSLRVDGTATYSAVTYDIPGGAQVEYRPRVTYSLAGAWSPGAWSADVRWHRIGRRFPNSAGTNPRPAFSLLDLALQRRLTNAVDARLEVNDLTDTRAEFIAGYPTPGRTFTATLNFRLQ
jgi:vitamin B12 transporter